MPAPQRIKDLVEKFRAHSAHYQSDKYTEEDVRHDFLNPFFAELGWDMDDRAARGARRDVRYETRVGTKAPDIQFYYEDKLRFFVEAKNPSVNVCADPKAALQLRTYGWSAKLPLSILTDFEEFSIYDTSIRPKASDSARVGRLDCLKFADLAEKWDEIRRIFSREAVAAGSLDSRVKKHTKDAVDDGLLEDISNWREILAKDIAKHHPDFSEERINHAVQDTLDRIIFLRICEDRGIEAEETLLKASTETGIYARLFKLFKNANSRYDSGLFEATGMEDLKIADDTLKTIVSELYFPKSPYKFDAIPTEILGQVYEQFLGQVIRKTESGRIKVQEKPEVRKAGGVYYTPKYIVEYIVRNTVGKLVEGKAPKDIKDLTIVDPACGSGSFLIGAYEFLMDWHRDWYVANNLIKHVKEGKIFEKENGRYLLKLPERSRILTTHIFGVDIDRQAVEVAKLSLMLKALEGETQVDPFNKRILPHLDQNIKCGNALIGTDYFTDEPTADPAEMARVNAFDWKTEFSTIFKRGGFDAVIGNPPYRRELDFKELMDEIARSTLGTKYRSPRMDLWYYFVHRGLEVLNKHGLLSFIVNSYWTGSTGASKLIETLKNEAELQEIFLLGKSKIFRGVSGQHMVIRLSSSKSVNPVTIKSIDESSGEDVSTSILNQTNINTFIKEKEKIFRNGKLDVTLESGDLLQKIEKYPPLQNLGKIRQGIAENPSSIGKKTNELLGGRYRIGEGVFVLTKEEVSKNNFSPKEKELLKPYHDLGDVGRYFINPHPSKTLIYSTKETCPDIDVYPGLRNHLVKFKKIMEERRETKKGSNAWWHLHWPREKTIWDSTKIISLQMAARPSFALKEGAAYVPFSMNVFLADSELTPPKAILGILNSRLMWYWFSHTAKSRGVGLEINGNTLALAPINIESKNRELLDVLSATVDKISTLSGLLADAKEDGEKVTLQRQIEATDRQIDQIVYKLYGLTDEEIGIVEEATK
jgi:type I restriction-modification system DNA methylase subunit